MYKTIIVVDSDDLLMEGEAFSVISFETYLSDYPKANEPKTRIINLCDTEHYLSRGYYCSLLAEARQHKVLPNVSTINDLRELATTSTAGIALPLPAKLFPIDGGNKTIEMLTFFGWTESEPWKKLARELFEKYPAPILKFCISLDQHGLSLQVGRYAFAQLNPHERELFLARLHKFTDLVWRTPASQKRQRWDMAIMVNAEEKLPPSNKDAIKRFVKAAAKVGIHAETINAMKSTQIPQYDALFIRETTAIDHPTYRLSRKAEQEGLVVIDDSTSILRCCNKVFLHDAFSYNRVPSLKTRVVIGSKESDLDEIETWFSYPMVVKIPEGSFSLGVFKISDRKELQKKLGELLKETALILVQEFLYTDFDWRIGVLNGRPIYACRYHMARNHWQIYNHKASRTSAGGFETLPTFEAPKAVLDAAVKACAIVGNGLYGVDIKQKGHQVYVIEVNDNPSIDHGVEDVYLGDELYMLIMLEFANRLEKRGR